MNPLSPGCDTHFLTAPGHPVIGGPRSREAPYRFSVARCDVSRGRGKLGWIEEEAHGQSTDLATNLSE